MPLSEPQRRICELEKIEPTPAALKKLMMWMMERWEMKQIGSFWNVSTKSLRQWVKDLGLTPPIDLIQERSLERKKEKARKKQEFYDRVETNRQAKEKKRLKVRRIYAWKIIS